jgi:hypothetical protein
MSYQTQPESAGLTRRKVIVTGVSAAAAGVVLGAGATVVGTQLTGGEAEATEGAAAPDKPVMIHLRDAATGHFDVFVGTERAQVTDRGFAARLSQAVAKIEGK